MAYIYKMELNDMIYIGSTTDMKQRQLTHNSKLRTGNDIRIYNYCRENDINQIELILLECVPIEDRYVVEQYYIDEYKGDKLLNCVNAIVDEENRRAQDKAYYETNREKIKKYREANKEQKKIYDKIYSEANKEQKNIYYQTYYEENKEKWKVYYQANKDSINEKRRLRRARKKAESN